MFSPFFCRNSRRTAQQLPGRAGWKNRGAILLAGLLLPLSAKAQDYSGGWFAGGMIGGGGLAYGGVTLALPGSRLGDGPAVRP